MVSFSQRCHLQHIEGRHVHLQRFKLRGSGSHGLVLQIKTACLCEKFRFTGFEIIAELNGE